MKQISGAPTFSFGVGSIHRRGTEISEAWGYRKWTSNFRAFSRQPFARFSVIFIFFSNFKGGTKIEHSTVELTICILLVFFLIPHCRWQISPHKKNANILQNKFPEIIFNLKKKSLKI